MSFRSFFAPWYRYAAVALFFLVIAPVCCKETESVLSINEVSMLDDKISCTQKELCFEADAFVNLTNLTPEEKKVEFDELCLNKRFGPYAQKLMVRLSESRFAVVERSGDSLSINLTEEGRLANIAFTLKKLELFERLKALKSI